MILHSRRWRLLIRTAVLLLAGVLMLVFAAPASYALQNDTPKLITGPTQLHDKTQPIADSYVYTSDVPDLSHVVTTHDLTAEYNWLAVPSYNGQLLVRAEGPSFLHAYYRGMDLNMYDSPVAANFYGKVTPLKGQADADQVVKDFAKHGISVEKETAMVILQGEEPRTYRPMVPVVGLLATSWLAALVGLLRILTGGPGRRRPVRYTSMAR